MEREVERLRDRVDGMHEDMSEMDSRIAEMASALRERTSSCPYRVEIARAGNNIARMQRMEEAIEATREASIGRDNALENKINDIQLVLAKSGVAGGAAGGGAVAMAISIIFGVGKLVGWW